MAATNNSSHSNTGNKDADLPLFDLNSYLTNNVTLDVGGNGPPTATTSPTVAVKRAPVFQGLAIPVFDFPPMPPRGFDHNTNNAAAAAVPRAPAAPNPASSTKAPITTSPSIDVTERAPVSAVPNLDHFLPAATLSDLPVEYSIICFATKELIDNLRREHKADSLSSSAPQHVHDFLRLSFDMLCGTDGVEIEQRLRLYLVKLHDIIGGFGWDFNSENSLSGRGFRSSIDASHLANVMDAATNITNDGADWHVTMPDMLPSNISWPGLGNGRHICQIKYRRSPVEINPLASPLTMPVTIQQDMTPIFGIWVGKDMKSACPLVISARYYRPKGSWGGTSAGSVTVTNAGKLHYVMQLMDSRTRRMMEVTADWMSFEWARPSRAITAWGNQGIITEEEIAARLTPYTPVVEDLRVAWRPFLFRPMAYVSPQANVLESDAQFFDMCELAFRDTVFKWSNFYAERTDSVTIEFERIYQHSPELSKPLLSMEGDAPLDPFRLEEAAKKVFNSTGAESFHFNNALIDVPDDEEAMIIGDKVVAEFESMVDKPGAAPAASATATAPPPKKDD